MASIHRPILKGTSYTCLDCGLFLRDVRTGSQLRQLGVSDWAREHDIKIKLGAVERRYLIDPEFAKKLATEDLKTIVSQYKIADKFNDFLMNPQARPDLQKPEAQGFLQTLQNGGYVNDKTDPLTPWLTREWKKGRIQQHPVNPNSIQFNAGPDYEHMDTNYLGEPTPWHTLSPDTLNHWGDWYRSNHPSRQGTDIMQMQAPQLHQTIKDWDTDMRDKAQGQAQTRGDIEHHYPDGWTVQRLTTSQQLEDEGDKMGHCVGGYAPQVERGHTLIYSLRDHQNEPHATWEITPQWHEGPDGKLYNTPENDGDFTTTPSPSQGELIQVQGKGNERPLPEYQKRIKDYMETKFPEKGDRPQWADQYVSDLAEDGDDEYGYHNGDYGLPKPIIDINWTDVINNAHPSWGYGYTHPSDMATFAEEHGELGQLEKAYDRWVGIEEGNFKDSYRLDGHISNDKLTQEYEERDPPPRPEEDEDTYQENDAYLDWQDRRDEWVDRMIDERLEEAWNNSEEGNYAAELETAIHSAKYRRRTRQSKTSPAHIHFTTGQPCNCSFTKHLTQRFGAWSENAGPGHCETCGDPLQRGRCNRCDWGGWTNSPDLTKNPQDPVKDLKGPTQSSWRELTPSG